VKSRIRLILPRGPAATKRLGALVRAQGGRVLRLQEWMRTSDVSVAEVLVLLKAGSASHHLRTALEDSGGMMVLDMHPVGDVLAIRRR